MDQIIALFEELNMFSVAFRIVLAVAVGGFIGNERGRHGRAAGLRTHILVCLGAAMTTLLGLYAVKCLGSNGDPLRMGAQVISGIGFLGAGTIMVRNRSHVTGLTTAAGLWATACIGLAIGAGFYWAAIVAFAAVMLTVTVIAHMEAKSPSRERGAYYIELTNIAAARNFCEDVENFNIEVNVVPARSGLSQHIGLEVIANSPEKYRYLKETMTACEDIALAVTLH